MESSVTVARVAGGADTGERVLTGGGGRRRRAACPHCHSLRGHWPRAYRKQLKLGFRELCTAMYSWDPAGG